MNCAMHKTNEHNHETAGNAAHTVFLTMLEPRVATQLLLSMQLKLM